MIHPRSPERTVRLAAMVAGDFLVAWGCLALAVFIRRNVVFDFTRSVLPPENFLLNPLNVLVFTLSLIFGLALSGFYTQRISRRHKPIIGAALLLQIAFVAVTFAVLFRPIPRTILFFVPIIESVALPAWRRLLARLFPIRPRETVLIGDSSDLTAFINAALDEEKRVRIVGLVGPTPPRYESVPYWGSLDNAEVCERLRDAEQVIYVSHGHDARLRLRLFSIRGPAGFLLLPSQADALLTSANFGWVGDQPLVEIAARCGFGAGLFVKRTADLILGSILAIVAIPTSAVLAAALWLEDRRPILIRQTRAGLGGEIFSMWKFRTMRVLQESDDELRLASDDDARVTRVGRWLRRHRLDELPQVINVLRGEMSLIGPRPERPEIIADIIREIPEFDLRLLVRPGIAGLAQVWAEYDTRPAVKLRYDLTYICAWTIWLDLRILLRAISTALSGRGV